VNGLIQSFFPKIISKKKDACKQHIYMEKQRIPLFSLFNESDNLWQLTKRKAPTIHQINARENFCTFGYILLTMAQSRLILHKINCTFGYILPTKEQNTLMREKINCLFGYVLPTRAQSRLMQEKVNYTFGYILPTRA